MKKHMLVLTIALALVGTACGGDDSDGGSNAAPSDPKAQELLAVIEADDEFPLTDAEANCTVNRLVNDLDGSTIDTILANPDSDLADVISPEENLVAVNALLDCVDIEQMMITGMMEDGADRESAECVAASLGEDELRTFMEAASLPEDQIDEALAFEIVGKMFEVAVECGLE